MICEKAQFHEIFKVELFFNRVLLTSEQNTNVAYEILLDNSQIVDWQIQKPSNQLVAFGFLIHDRWNYFQMEKNSIIFLKQFLDGKVQYKNIDTLYRAVSFSGKGTFGKVFKFQRNDGKILACKSLKMSKYTTLETFLQEVSALQNLKHPNILKLQEFYIEKKHFYIFTDYLEFGSLADLILRKKLIDEEIIQILRVCFSSIIIHCQGYVYRDIKQENIMFAEKQNLNSLKIIDLGLTMKLRELQKLPHRICGTPGYMAPEATQAAEICKFTTKSDVFGIGVLLWEMITGTEFFICKDAMQKFQENQNFQFSEKCVEHVENRFFKLMLEKMLQTYPSKRIESWEALELIKWIDQCF